MGVNAFIGNLAVQELEKMKSELYDAIVEGDYSTVLYIVNNKYKSVILGANCIKEAMSITKMIQAIEIGLDRNKGIRLIC